MQYGYKNIAEFDVGFESVDKVAKKTHAKKVINEKVAEILSFFTFTFECKNFRSKTFFVNLFAFFQWILLTRHQI
jgi:hypothetical protein